MENLFEEITKQKIWDGINAIILEHYPDGRPKRGIRGKGRSIPEGVNKEDIYIGIATVREIEKLKKEGVISDEVLKVFKTRNYGGVLIWHNPSAEILEDIERWSGV